MSTQAYASVKRIMERAQALKRRLSDASDHSSGSFKAFEQERVEQNANQINVHAHIGEPTQTIFTQPPVNYIAKPRQQKLLVYPIYDYPFLCLLLVSSFRSVGDLASLSPTGAVDEVFLRITANPLQPSRNGHILFDFYQIYQISLSLVAYDEGDEFVLATAPVVTAEGLKQALLATSEKRRFSRKQISFVFKRSCILKSTNTTPESVGALSVAVADLVLLCGGSRLLEFEGNLSALPACVQRLQRPAQRTADLGVYTDEVRAQKPDPMHNMRRIGRVQIVVRIGGICLYNAQNTDTKSIYVSFTLYPDAKFQAVTGMQAKHFQAIPQTTHTSRQFCAVQRGGFLFSDAHFNVGKTLVLTPDVVTYMTHGSLFLAVFGVLKSGKKAFFGCCQVLCNSQRQANWAGFKYNGGYVYCDVQTIRGNDMEDFITYEYLIAIKGLPAEYEMADASATDLSYRPFAPVQSQFRTDAAYFLYKREVNPYLSQVAPLREKPDFEHEIGAILGVGQKIDAIFDETD